MKLYEPKQSANLLGKAKKESYSVQTGDGATLIIKAMETRQGVQISLKGLSED